MIAIGVALPGRVMGADERLLVGEVWDGTDLELPEGCWRNVLTGNGGFGDKGATAGHRRWRSCRSRCSATD